MKTYKLRQGAVIPKNTTWNETHQFFESHDDTNPVLIQTQFRSSLFRVIDSYPDTTMLLEVWESFGNNPYHKILDIVHFLSDENSNNSELFDYLMS